jgi:hypothetical protein
MPSRCNFSCQSSTISVGPMGNDLFSFGLIEVVFSLVCFDTLQQVEGTFNSSQASVGHHLGMNDIMLFQLSRSG